MSTYSLNDRLLCFLTALRYLLTSMFESTVKVGILMVYSFEAFRSGSRASRAFLKMFSARGLSRPVLALSAKNFNPLYISGITITISNLWFWNCEVGKGLYIFFKRYVLGSSSICRCRISNICFDNINCACL